MTESVGVGIAFGAGVLSFLSPCVLPLVPSYLSFVTGMSLEDLQEGVNRRTTMIHSLLFVAGFTGIFLVLGASASFLGQFLRAYETWIARVGGLLIILLGLHLAGAFRLTPLMRERRVHLNDKPAGYLGTLGVGAVFGAGWTPCIGPVLGAILTFAASQEQFWSGVTLLLDLARRAASALPDYDIEVVEAHHRGKVDAPSGTALALAKAAARGRGLDLEEHAIFGRRGRTGPRGTGDIGIHAVRMGDVVGEHQVWLAGRGDRVLLGHTATSRATFAEGALRAAQWIRGKPPGRYGMQDVLGLNR